MLTLISHKLMIKTKDDLALFDAPVSFDLETTIGGGEIFQLPFCYSSSPN